MMRAILSGFFIVVVVDVIDILIQYSMIVWSPSIPVHY